jgi:hypothetical protein
VKFASSQLAFLLGNREARANLGTLLKYVLTSPSSPPATPCWRV